MAGDLPTIEPATLHLEPEQNSQQGRLAFRPQPPVAHSARPGLRAFDDDGAPLGLVYAPPYADNGPFRLVLLLHGAGGSARQGIELMLPVADEHRLLLVAPKSRLLTWDVIIDGYGADVRRIDRLLDEVTAAYPVDRFTAGGFSDGASYAVSLGLTNGDLLDSVVAFSPCFGAPLVQHGNPRLFISHGTKDTVLPIDRCSRRLVRRLTQSGYQVTYLEFDGPHTVPTEVVDRAATWLVDAPSRAQRADTAPV
ncbi:MAG: phospholipase [Actinomycetota bacterium]|nr:phospholipase [Actinomycetota bacterium]